MTAVAADGTAATASDAMAMPMAPASPMPTRAHDMPAAHEGLDSSAPDPSMMPSITDIGSPMTREGSGTSWMPDATTMYGRIMMRGGDMMMTHGALWLRYADTGSTRGEQKISLPSWWMYLRSHPTSPGAQLGFRAMLSGDFLGVGGSGYPLLFQTGEAWKDRPLHDTQHPHDLISELSLTYSGALGDRHSAYLYAGYPGDPALGPPAFMHRPIAYDYAPSPLGHHWEDATHVAFGVLTAGIASTRFKIEGSSFTGREPNQARANFDPIHLDSYGERLSWNPNRFLAAQVSSGFIKSPEALTPSVDIFRTTASVLYSRRLGPDSSWSHGLVFGRNLESDGRISNAYLYETDFRRRGNALFGRAEIVRKVGSELALAPIAADHFFNIGAYTLGFAHDLPHKSGDMVPALGVDLTINSKPASLNSFYGSGYPVSFEVFFRLRPSALAAPRSERRLDRVGNEKREAVAPVNHSFNLHMPAET